MITENKQLLQHSILFMRLSHHLKRAGRFHRYTNNHERYGIPLVYTTFCNTFHEISVIAKEIYLNRARYFQLDLPEEHSKLIEHKTVASALNLSKLMCEMFYVKAHQVTIMHKTLTQENLLPADPAVKALENITLVRHKFVVHLNDSVQNYSNVAVTQFDDCLEPRPDGGPAGPILCKDISYIDHKRNRNVYDHGLFVNMPKLYSVYQQPDEIFGYNMTTMAGEQHVRPQITMHTTG